MGRLINADKLYESLIENISWLKEQDYETYCVVGDEIRFVTDQQPTAYDPDKVVEQLEKLKKTEKDRPDDCDENGYGDAEQIYDDGRSQGRFEAYRKAIEIVKSGGVDMD